MNLFQNHVQEYFAVHAVSLLRLFLMLLLQFVDIFSYGHEYQWNHLQIALFLSLVILSTKLDQFLSQEICLQCRKSLATYECYECWSSTAKDFYAWSLGSDRSWFTPVSFWKFYFFAIVGLMELHQYNFQGLGLHRIGWSLQRFLVRLSSIRFYRISSPTCGCSIQGLQLKSSKSETVWNLFWVFTRCMI